MSDDNILVNPGSITKVDTRTVGAGTDEHRQVMVIGDPTTAAAVAAVRQSTTDGDADTDYGQTSLDRNYLFNGTGWDRERNDVELILLSSAPRSTTTPSADVIAHNAESLLLMVSVTTIGTGSITPSLQGKEPVGGVYFTFWTAEQPITANGVYAYFFANGASGGEFTECQAFGLGPRVWKLTLTANNGNSVTYSASCVMGDN